MYLSEFLQTRTYCKPKHPVLDFIVGRYHGRYLELCAEIRRSYIIEAEAMGIQGICLECVDEMAFIQIDPETGRLNVSIFEPEDNINFDDPLRKGHRIH